MMGAVLLLTAVALLLSMLHAYGNMRWRRSLHAYRFSLPRDLSIDDTARWLATIAATTHPPRWSLFPLSPVVIEVLATTRGITYYVLVAAAIRRALLAGVQATLPGARLDEEPSYLLSRSDRLTVAAEFTTTSRARPLAAERVEAVSRSLAATLQPLRGDERVVLQLVLTSAGTPAAAAGSVPTSDLAARSARRQIPQYDPLLVATVRIGATARSRQRASALLARSARMLPGLNTPGVRLVRRFVPSFVTRQRMAARRYPLIEWPLLLTVHEATGLIALPIAGFLPGAPSGQARQVPPPPTLPAAGAVVGHSNYPGLSHRVLALNTDDRLHHVHLIGPTGTGKSTLLARLALQDIERGSGVVVIDLKGDLVRDIAARIPVERRAEVVLLDPSALEPRVIGFNPLALAHRGDGSCELIAERVLSVFHSVYAEFWGPRTDEIMRATLFSLVSSTAPDGSAFTLIEAPELLTNPAFRRYVTAHPDLPPAVRSFWQWFDGSLRPMDRTEAIAPVLNKLRAFAMRQNIRLLLGQSEGIPFDMLFRRRGVLLISLAKGALGSGAARLLGALFLATLWEAAQSRITEPSDQRHPVFAYLDEFQDIVQLGAETSLTDVLAQARGLGLSLTLAHQYLSQLPPAVREATLGTVRTHISFQLASDDAQALAARFTPLTSADLSGLNPFEFALKPFVAGQVLPPVTGVTLPLGTADQDSAALGHASRALYGMARSDIEAGLEARLRVTAGSPDGRYGREAKTRHAQGGNP